MIKLNDIIPLLEEIIVLLIAKQYKSIVKLDYLKNYSESELEESILDYGGDLTMPPKKVLQECEIYLTDDNKIVRVDFDLWFDGERSDLTLSWSVYKVANKYKFSIDNIRIK